METETTSEETLTPKIILSTDDINELMKDWFVRDSETFTRISSDSKLAWEPSSGTYSDYLMEGKTYSAKEIFSKAYELARNTIISMDIPFRVKVLLDPKNSSTDGTIVRISTEVFDEKDYTVGEQIDVFLGLCVHEGSHLLYTDMEMYKNIFKSETGRITTRQKVIGQFSNIYEDERIEMQLGYDKPGYTRYLEKVKYYYFDKFFMDGREEDIPLTLETAFTIATNSILRIVRFPRYLRVEDVEFFGEYLIRIKDLLTPYPSSTAEVIECADATYQILLEFIKEKFEDELTEKSPGGEGGEGEPSPLSDVDATKKVEDAMDKGADEFAKKVKSAFGGDSEGEGTKLSDKLKGRLVDVIEGSVEKGKGDTYTSKARTDMDTYKRVLRKVSPYVSAVRKVLQYNDKDYKIVTKCMRNGYLDTNRLVEASLGVPTVYEGYGRVVSDKVAICFLIDQSGSMSGSDIEAAQQCAILLYEALKTNRSIQLFIYGHSADIKGSSTELYTYVEPGYAPKGALGSVRALRENRDGEAILETAIRIRKKTSRKCLMFILSDGQPCAGGYHGKSAIRDTKEKVRRASKMGFDICQIAINSSYDPKEMFDHHVVLEDLGSLARDLGKFMKKSILKNQKIRII